MGVSEWNTELSFQVFEIEDCKMGKAEWEELLEFEFEEDEEDDEVDEDDDEEVMKWLMVMNEMKDGMWLVVNKWIDVLEKDDLLLKKMKKMKEKK